MCSFFRRKKSTPAALPVTDTVLSVAVLSDVGNLRKNNEDRAICYKTADPVVSLTKGQLLLVADGMGGHQAGEIASQLATDVVSTEYFHASKKMPNADALRAAFTLANRKIFELASTRETLQGMGTTCTALAVRAHELYYAHVGDSRAYLLSGDRMIRLTQDHTYVQELVNKGEISDAETATHPQRNILTNAMGTKSSLHIDAGRSPHQLEPGNRLLLCSDGLYDYLSDEELYLLAVNGDLQVNAEQLIALAKQRGGHDNITVVLAAVSAAGSQRISSTRETVLP